MDRDTYSVIAQERWNRWVRRFGIEIFAVRPDSREFMEHGSAEAAIFMDPKQAAHLRPKGNSEKWPGEFRHGSAIQELLSKPVSESVMLEFGCGTARLTVPFSRHFKHVIGYDISGEAIKLAEKMATLQNARNIRFISALSVLEVAQPQTIDFIFSYIVFQHISNPETIEETIADFSVLLSPRGVGRIHVRVKGKVAPEHNCFQGAGFPRETYFEICTRSGLKVVEFLEDGDGETAFLTFIKTQP